MDEYYKALNDILLQVIQINILGNQNLCKLLYYYPDKANISFSPFVKDDGSEREYVDPNILYMSYVFPMPKMPDNATEQKCILLCSIDGGEYTHGIQWREACLTFDIICHLDAWNIKEGFRVFHIANELDKTFQQKDPQSANRLYSDNNSNYLLDIPSISKPYALPFRTYDYSFKYYGLKMRYCLKMQGSSLCGDKT